MDSPLLPQFIPEARDLLEQAGRSLLLLERDPAAAEPMNALFRAMHTLKGTSGLFEIGPFTRLVHAAEDLLCAAQAGRLDLAPAHADLLLATLDRLAEWIESLAEASLLPDGAEAASADLSARLRAHLGGAGQGAAAAAATAPPPAWLAALPPDVLAALPPGQGFVALRYTPDEHCFFRGEDPLGLVRLVPGLAWLALEPCAPWPAASEIDPYRSQLRYLAIAAAEPGVVEDLFRYVPDQVEIAALPPEAIGPRMAAPGAFAAPADEVSETVRALLAAQRRLLEAGGGEGAADPIAAGRIAAARSAIGAAIAHAGWSDPVPQDAAGLLGLIATLEARLDAPAPLQAAEAPETAAQRPAGADTARGGPATTLRVEQAKIDALMNLIGELVVAKNALAWLSRRAEDGSLGVRELAREIKDRQALVSRIAEEMQTAVMAVRMMPVENVFQRFPRLVRDTARRLDKRVELLIEGGETEADKTVVEALADPLIHMVRNSLDHGIEPPAERLAAGKPEHGTLRLEARQGNDQVVIRVVDDGRGLDPEKLRRRVLEKGLMEPERVEALTDQEACELIFLPGFSTAATISDLSGRGVGMDVVRSTIAKAGGSVSLSSRKGEGTVVEITLPLSMAVTRLMTVACGERLFGVPMGLVIETVRVPRAAVRRIGQREAFVLRDRVVPLLRLAHLLDLPEEDSRAEEEAVLVVRVGGERLGLVVGAFREVMEAIVKPLEGVIAGLPGFAGTTLLGDGRVLLILDLPELVR
ncbi:chemotaxis protein CheA [Roseomonas sp. PWR1]|uniref:histidine kinase n=1 Tax=Roseomonas nitratireducens TaxID=2820810 RepID=A0ABS4ASV0_9PROT|nr:chemotaxis protein CheA [Neoroseomonas nitratireducens]